MTRASPSADQIREPLDGSFNKREWSSLDFYAHGAAEITGWPPEHLRKRADGYKDDWSRQNPQFSDECTQFRPSIRVCLNDDFLNVRAASILYNAGTKPLALIGIGTRERQVEMLSDGVSEHI